MSRTLFWVMLYVQLSSGDLDLLQLQHPRLYLLDLLEVQGFNSNYFRWRGLCNLNAL